MTDNMYEIVAVQQTADLIMSEVRASCPCGSNHIRNWLIEQCTFGYAYMGDAVDMLVEAGALDVDEDGIFDLPQYVDMSKR